MARSSLALLVLALFVAVVIAQQPITTFKVWPYPASFTTGASKICVPANSISFEITTPSQNIDPDCNGILDRAVERYKKSIFVSPLTKPITANQVKIPETPTLTRAQHIQVLLQPTDLKSCAAVDMDTMNEKYQVDITQKNEMIQVVIKSDTVWGTLRGIETFAQRVVSTLERVNPDTSLVWTYCLSELPLSITDGPRFPWRGMFFF